MEDNRDPMAAARIGKLRKEADKYGVHYTNETSEDALRAAVDEAKAPREQAPAPAPAQAVLPASAIGEIVREVRKALAPDTIKDGIVQERDVDPDDRTDEKTYFHPAIFWILPLKRVGGQLVMPPFGKRIMFKREYGAGVRSGNQWNTRYVSVYRTKSKREIQYIETHELFGKTFFTSHAQAEALTGSARRGIVFGKFMNSLSVTPPDEVYRMAAANGIETGVLEELATLRTRLADKLTDAEMVRAEAHEKQLLASGRKGLLGAPVN